MKYTSLPGTELPASRVVLGTAWFGTAIAEDASYKLMDAFVEQGGNFLDTAHMYANWVKDGAGKSESTIGKWLRTTRPKNIVIATKGADKGMTRDGIRAQLKESLDRLGLDRVAFYWLHRDDPSVPAGDIIEWLNELVREGRFRAFGCSNWLPDRIAEAQVYAAQKRLRGFAASQIGWSLARVVPEVRGGGMVFMDDATMAYHEATGLPCIAYSAQAGGFFGGNFDPKGPPPGVTPNAGIVKYYGCPANYHRLEATNKMAKQKGVTPNQLSLAYLLCQSFPGFAIAGANSPERVADACGAASIELTRSECNTIFSVP